MATLREAAPRGPTFGRGYGPRDRAQAPTAARRLSELGPCREQRARVGVKRRAKDLVRGSALDDLARVEHDHAIGALRHNPEIVRDEDQAQTLLGAEAIEQVEHLRLERWVERRGGFVGEHERGLRRDGDRDEHALTQAAGELVGKAPRTFARIGKTHGAKHMLHASRELSPAQVFVQRDRLGDLVAHAHHRVEAGHRVLEDHRDALAAEAPKSGRGEVEDGGFAEGELFGAHLALGAEEAEDRERGHALSRAALADDRDAFALVHREGHVVDHRAHGPRAAKAHGETTNEEERYRSHSQAIPWNRASSLDEAPFRWQTMRAMKNASRTSLVLVALLSLACAKSSAQEPAPPIAVRAEAAPLAETKVDSADHTVSFDQKGACALGSVCTAVIRLETKGGFHVNEQFPYKFKGVEAPGVELQGADAAKKNDFSKAAGDLTIESKTVATLAVRFKPVAQNGKISGVYKYAICNEANCFPKEAAMSLAVVTK
jgi:hypothetical protein